MDSLLLHTLRSRWFAACVHVALWLLLYLALVHAKGHAPRFGEGTAASPAPQSVIPVAKLDAVFTGAQQPSVLQTNTLDPFYTRYFVPPPSPAPPPPPTTRKVPAIYEGYYQTGDGPKFALVKLGDAFVTTRVGTALATNLIVADATMQMLTLTNAAAQTNLLQLNSQKDLEVPIK